MIPKLLCAHHMKASCKEGGGWSGLSEGEERGNEFFFASLHTPTFESTATVGAYIASLPPWSRQGLQYTRRGRLACSEAARILFFRMCKKNIGEPAPAAFVLGARRSSLPFRCTDKIRELVAICRKFAGFKGKSSPKPRLLGLCFPRACVLQIWKPLGTQSLVMWLPSAGLSRPSLVRRQACNFGRKICSCNFSRQALLAFLKKSVQFLDCKNIHPYVYCKPPPLFYKYMHWDPL